VEDENTGAAEQLVFSQEDAPEIHRTVRHFELKNDIIVNLTPTLETYVF